jgi:hypothetical protein
MSTSQPDTRQESRRSSKLLLWKVILIVLFIVDVLCAYFLNFWGDSALLIKLSFFILPIINLIFLCGLIISWNTPFLLKIGIVLLIIANVLFGYNVYDQERYGFGLGFLGVIPFLFVLLINDLILLLTWKDST